MGIGCLPNVQALLPHGVDCSNPGANIVCTPFGNFNLRPAAGEALIPRNFGEGTGFLSVNIRVSKTWNFGTIQFVFRC